MIAMSKNKTNEFYLAIYPAERKGEKTSLILSQARRFAADHGLPPPGDPEIIRGQRGKPDFAAGANLHFSYSDSDDYCVIAVGAACVGVDIQALREGKLERIARRFFHADEQAFAAENKAHFFDVWAAKESYVKYTGEGITEGFSTFSVVKDGRIAPRTLGKQLVFYDFDPGYRLCLCADPIFRVHAQLFL